jgi:hypothetical protein
MIYLYGLQRSGTNVINDFLETNYGLKIVKHYKDRLNPAHKHFRIYDKKELAPIGFSNTHTVNTIEDLDTLLNDKAHTNKYIVIFKTIYSWLPSIKKWAKQCKWPNTSTEFFLDDYFAFLDKWNALKHERVLFIEYDDYLNLTVGENNDLPTQIEKFLNVTKKKANLIFPKEVSLSEKFSPKRLNYYKNKEYMGLLTEEEIKLTEERLLIRSSN